MDEFTRNGCAILGESDCACINCSANAIGEFDDVFDLIQLPQFLTSIDVGQQTATNLLLFRVVVMHDTLIGGQNQ